MGDDAFAAGQEAPASGFVVRTLLSLGWPYAWQEGSRAMLGELLLGIALVSALLHGGLGLYRAWDFGQFLYRTGAEYDAAYDPIVLENGTIRVDGPRIVYYVDPNGRNTMLVDPEETVPDSAITTPESIVVRRDSIVQHKAFGQVQTIPVSQLEEVFGIRSLVIDGQHLRDFASSWGVVLGASIAALLLVFGVTGDLLGALGYGAMAAGIIGLLPFAAGWTFQERWRLAIAASTALIFPGWLASLLGIASPCCMNLVVWPAILTVLAGVGVGLAPPRR